LPGFSAWAGPDESPGAQVVESAIASAGEAMQRRMDDSVRGYAAGDGFALPYVAYVISAGK